MKRPTNDMVADLMLCVRALIRADCADAPRRHRDAFVTMVMKDFDDELRWCEDVWQRGQCCRAWIAMLRN
jgi:hypothetical protein